MVGSMNHLRSSRSCCSPIDKGFGAVSQSCNGGFRLPGYSSEAIGARSDGPKGNPKATRGHSLSVSLPELMDFHFSGLDHSSGNMWPTLSMGEVLQDLEQMAGGLWNAMNCPVG